MDVATVKRIVELLEPMKALGTKHIGGFVYDYVRKMGSLVRGREAECLMLCERNEAMLADPTLLPEYPPAARMGNYIGLHHTLPGIRARARLRPARARLGASAQQWRLRAIPRDQRPDHPDLLRRARGL